VTGDTSQVDLPAGQPSGLVDAQEILRRVDGIAFTHFGAQDVVRHPLVARIVDAYGRRPPGSLRSPPPEGARSGPAEPVPERRR
jgi:phosphate starvation-inducible protein PhoH